MRYLILALFASGMFLTPVSIAAPFSTKIINNQGNKIGWLRIRKAPQGGILLDIKARKLSPGKHEIHFHSVGDCSDTEGFQLSMGHIQKPQQEHGFLNEQGIHLGDLPNLVVSRKGRVRVELYIPNLKNLRDDDGSALVIHADPDDHLTQPIGNSGARVACAEIK